MISLFVPGQKALVFIYYQKKEVIYFENFEWKEEKKEVEETDLCSAWLIISSQLTKLKTKITNTFFSEVIQSALVTADRREKQLPNVSACV